MGASNLADKGRTRSPGWKLELDKFNLEISQQPEQLNAGAGGGRGWGGGSGSLGSNRFGGRDLQAAPGKCQPGSAAAPAWCCQTDPAPAGAQGPSPAGMWGATGRHGGGCTAASHVAFVLSRGLACMAGGNVMQAGEGRWRSCRCCMCSWLPPLVGVGACAGVQASCVPYSCPGCRPHRSCWWTQAQLGPCELRSLVAALCGMRSPCRPQGPRRPAGRSGKGHSPCTALLPPVPALAGARALGSVPANAL